MARKYTRNRSGQFAGGGSLGDRAETIQQNKAKKTATRKAERQALSGSHLGSKGKRKRAGVRTKVRGSKATTKRAMKVAQRTRRRFG